MKKKSLYAFQFFLFTFFVSTRLSGQYAQNGITVATGLTVPKGIFLDNSGNLFVGLYKNYRKELILPA